MALPFTFQSLPTGNVPAADLDTNFVQVASTAIVPCTATGTNAITLTPLANNITISVYANYLNFGFVAAATSTGSVTINVSSVGALPLYIAGSATSQATAGTLTVGVFYVVTYNLALNSGAGGFQIIGGSGAGSGSSLPIVIVQDRKASGSAGSALTQNVYTDHDLNTLILNTVGGVTAVSTPNLTLPSGTYDVNAWCTINPGAATLWRVRLFNTTGAAVQTDTNGNDVVGLSMSSGAAGIPALLRARFTISTQSNLKFQLWNGAAGSTQGAATSGSGNTEPEVYLSAEFTKVA